MHPGMVLGAFIMFGIVSEINILETKLKCYKNNQ